FRDLIRYVMAHPFLTDVSVAGPYDARKPQSALDAKWSSPVVGPPGAIPLPATKDPSVAYVIADLTTPTELRTQLQLGAAHDLLVLVNGDEVYHGKPGSSPASPDQASLDVTLRAGRNRLFIQVTYRGDK